MDATQNNQTDSAYGNYKILCWLGDEPLFLLGPHHYVFLPSLIIFSAMMLLLFAQSQQAFAPLWKVLVFSFIALFIVAYLTVGLSNPGLIPKNILNQQTNAEVPNQTYCKFCNRNRARYTKHCQDCNICIKGYDHHCVWVGKCIGENNLCRFYTFLGSLSGTFIVFFVAVLNSSGF